MKLHLPQSLSTTRLPRYGEKPRPQRDWFIMVLALALLFLASIGWNIWYFMHITQREPAESSTFSPETTELNVIRQTEELFRARSAEEARYRTEYRFVDPS